MGIIKNVFEDCLLFQLKHILSATASEFEVEAVIWMLLQLGFPALRALAERIEGLLQQLLDLAEVVLLICQLNCLLDLVVSQDKIWVYSGVH